MPQTAFCVAAYANGNTADLIERAESPRCTKTDFLFLIRLIELREISNIRNEIDDEEIGFAYSFADYRSRSTGNSGVEKPIKASPDDNPQS